MGTKQIHELAAINLRPLISLGAILTFLIMDTKILNNSFS